MGEYADEEINRWIGDAPWGGTGRYIAPPVKRRNSDIFAAFAGEPSKFKAGDRVVHKPSGSVGTVVSTRGSQTCWRPDSRIKPGGVWVDSEKLRYDI